MREQEKRGSWEEGSFHQKQKVTPLL
jgi:hypothetical protein